MNSQGKKESLALGYRESDIQRAFFEFVNIQAKTLANWRTIMATPNQGYKDSARWGAFRKAEGASAGFPDISVLIARGGYHGLFIELKTAKGRLQDNQKEWLKNLNNAGYLALCVFTNDVNDLILLVTDYIYLGKVDIKKNMKLFN